MNRRSLLLLALGGVLALFAGCREDEPAVAARALGTGDEKATPPPIERPRGTLLTILFTGNGHGEFDAERG